VLGATLPGGNVAAVVAATLADGTPAVLKQNPPDAVESEHEALALALWDGDGAVRLLAHDPARRALLLERCVPGDALLHAAGDDEAGDVVCALLARLHRAPPPGHPFGRLAEVAPRWAVAVEERWRAAGRPFARALLHRALAALRDLPATGGPAEVLLHQDLHAANVLRAARAPWLVIDPKPLVGDPAFDLASLLRDRRPELARDPGAAARVRRRLDRLSAGTGLDRERVRGWGVAHALAWGFEDGAWLPGHVACAEWIAAA
jgi:streptomycin 6-kinase